MIAFSEDSDDNRRAAKKDMDAMYRKTLRVIEAVKIIEKL